MRCKKCNGYIPEGIKITVCPDCGSELAEPASRQPVPKLNDELDIKQKPDQTIGRRASRQSIRLRQKTRRPILTVKRFLASNSIAAVNGFLLLTAITFLVASLHFSYPELAAYALDFISITAALFFFIRFRSWQHKRQAIPVNLGLILITGIYAYRAFPEPLRLYKTQMGYHINRGKANSVAVGDKYIVLGEKLAGANEQEEVGLVRVVRLQRRAAEIAIADILDNRMKSAGPWPIRSYDANLAARRFTYGQIVEYDVITDIARVNLGKRSGLIQGDSLTVLGSSVADLTFEATPLGRKIKGRLDVERVFDDYAEAIPVANKGAALAVGDFVVRQLENSRQQTPVTTPPPTRVETPRQQTSVTTPPPTQVETPTQQPNAGQQVAILKSFGKYRDHSEATLSFVPGLKDLCYGYSASDLSVNSGQESNSHYGHIVNLGAEVRFNSVQLNTDRSYGGGLFQGIGRDQAAFIRHSFCLLGLPMDVLEATNLLSTHLAPKVGDVLLVRSLHVQSPRGYIDCLVKLQILKHIEGDQMQIAWSMLYRRDVDPFSPQNPALGITISGDIRDAETRNGIESAAIEILDGIGNHLKTTRSSADGTFSAILPRSEEIIVQVNTEGYSTTVERLRLPRSTMTNIGSLFIRKTESLEDLGISGQTILFLIDRSGSMSGVFPSVKRQLTSVLTTLPAGKRFNVAFFDDSMTSFSPHMELASSSNVVRACEFVSHIETRGGTEIVKALQECRRFGFMDTIYILSDAEFSPGEDLRFQSILRSLATEFGTNIVVSSVHYGDPRSARVLESLDVFKLGKHKVGSRLGISRRLQIR